MKKKIAITMAVIILLALVGAVCFLIVNKNNGDSENDVFTKSEDEIGQNGTLSDISFNKMKIGDKATKKMLDGLVLDWDQRYQYQNIYFDVDSNNKITCLAFYTITRTEGDGIGMEDANIKCQGKSLITIEDFQDCFGEGEVSCLEEDPDWVFITYTENGLKLTLEIHEDVLKNVELTSR